MLKDFISEEEGQTLVEYALLLSFIALVTSIALSELGLWLKYIFFTATHPIINALGNLKLSEITAEQIGSYQTKRLVKVKPKTINLEISVLRMILKSVRLWGRISDDVQPLKAPKKAVGRALTPQQENTLFKTAKKNPDWEVAYCAAVIAATTTA